MYCRPKKILVNKKKFNSNTSSTVTTGAQKSDIKKAYKKPERIKEHNLVIKVKKNEIPDDGNQKQDGMEKQTTTNTTTTTTKEINEKTKPDAKPDAKLAQNEVVNKQINSNITNNTIDKKGDENKQE